MKRRFQIRLLITSRIRLRVCNFIEKYAAGYRVNRPARPVTKAPKLFNATAHPTLRPRI